MTARARKQVADAGENRTDLGNARRFVRQHGRDLRFVPQSRKWIVWDGRRWSEDRDGEVMRRAKSTALSIYAEAATATMEEAKEIAKHGTRSQSEPRLRAMISLAESEVGIPVQAGALDADPWLFNVLNGTLDLHTGDLLPHRREALLTKVAPVEFDSAAECPVFHAFLLRSMDGRPDLVEFIQRYVGYTLTGSTREQVLAFLHGAGANGKSTLLELLAYLFGDYAAKIDFASLLAKGTDSGPRNDLARLAGARFVSGAEAEEGRRFSEVVVKEITGGDTITARFLFQEHFEFRPQFKLFLAANHKPTIRGTDHAIWRRIRLVPFDVTIPTAERDGDLPDKLRAEAPGILAWAVRGCMDWQRGGLGLPEAVRAATEEYREEMDALGGFLGECCYFAPDAESTAKDCWAAYLAWCEREGDKPLSRTAFGRRLSEREGVRKEKVSGGLIRYFGIGVSELSGQSGQSGQFGTDFRKVQLEYPSRGGIGKTVPNYPKPSQTVAAEPSTYPCAGCGQFAFADPKALCFACRKQREEGAA